MIETTQRKLTYAFLALLLILAGCKGESPTAPPPIGTGPTPGGGTPPPTNASITLSVSNPTPIVNSTSVITATVTQDGQAVPNGTAVQFSTTLGTFTESGAQSALRTTTGGVATATVTSATPGTATITATVNNVTRSTTVTFSAQPVTPTPPSTAPTITSITPATGRPEGGEQISIVGTNLRTPVRVLFDPGSGQAPKEGFVVSVTSTQIVVLTPRVDLGTGQTLATDVIVIIEAGTPTEQRVVKAQGFTFQAAVLTPSIRALQPTSGPVSGGTRVTIIGDAFQAPVQVFFGLAEAQVISVNFAQIVVMSPAARDTAPDGSGVVTGPVDIKVVNINSNKSATMTGGFRYTPKMQITTAGPLSGPFTGGTRITIDGIGFDDPLAVFVAAGSTDIGAQVIRVSGTQIIAITGALSAVSCADVSGEITVVNTNNGDFATGPTFTYRVPLPVITFISNPNLAGGTATVTVLNAQGLARFTIGGVQANITARIDNADGTTTFTLQIPTTLRLQTLACPGGGAAPQPTAFDVAYTNLLTGCTTTAPSGLTVEPAAAPVLFLSPGAFQPFRATIVPGNPAAVPPTPTTVTPSPTQQLNIINTGTTVLSITGITTAGAGCPRFSVAAPPIPPNIDLQQCESLPIIVQYNGQTTPTTETCTVTITTNAGTRSLLLVGTSQ